jgi:hypothetical protein
MAWKSPVVLTQFLQRLAWQALHPDGIRADDA